MTLAFICETVSNFKICVQLYQLIVLYEGKTGTYKQNTLNRYMPVALASKDFSILSSKFGKHIFLLILWDILGLASATAGGLM